MIINTDFIHKYTRRKKGHDYYAPCHYHIILRKAQSCPRFGNIPYVPGLNESMRRDIKPVHNKLGKIICGNIWNIKNTFPQLQVGQYCVMPDHVHIFLAVKKKTDKHLGKMIGILKSNIAKEYSSYIHSELDSSAIFEENFTDKIIYLGMDFSVFIQYIIENPYRAATCKQNREYFTRRIAFTLDDIDFEGYGNQFIAENPAKMAVRVSRKIPPEAFREYEDKCLEHVAEGGVLVSPFISPGEKAIRDKAYSMGARMICVKYKAFSDKFKPPKEEFNQCSKGKLLMVAPKVSFGKELCKPISDKLNHITEMIAQGQILNGLRETGDIFQATLSLH